MRLTLLNGSPRGKKSNTRVVMAQLVDGFAARGDHQVETFYIAKRASWPDCRRAMAASDIVIFAMPLYVHAMPALDKEFIETLEPFEPGAQVKMGFVVQSGFPEPEQSFWLRRYLERLPARLGAEYLGTAIKGAVEGVQVVPDMMKRKTLGQFHALGEQLGETGALDDEVIREMAGPDRMTAGGRMMFRLFNSIGMGPDGYFGRQLKANGAYEKSFDRPYAPDRRAKVSDAGATTPAASVRSSA